MIQILLLSFILITSLFGLVFAILIATNNLDNAAKYLKSKLPSKTHKPEPVKVQQVVYLSERDENGESPLVKELYNRLQELGYTVHEIDLMTPVQALDNLRNQRKPVVYEMQS